MYISKAITYEANYTDAPTLSTVHGCIIVYVTLNKIKVNLKTTLENCSQWNIILNKNHNITII